MPGTEVKIASSSPYKRLLVSNKLSVTRKRVPTNKYIKNPQIFQLHRFPLLGCFYMCTILPLNEKKSIACSEVVEELKHTYDCIKRLQALVWWNFFGALVLLCFLFTEVRNTDSSWFATWPWFNHKLLFNCRDDVTKRLYYGESDTCSFFMNLNSLELLSRSGSSGPTP